MANLFSHAQAAQKASSRSPPPLFLHRHRAQHPRITAARAAGLLCSTQIAAARDSPRGPGEILQLFRELRLSRTTLFPKLPATLLAARGTERRSGARVFLRRHPKWFARGERARSNTPAGQMGRLSFSDSHHRKVQYPIASADCLTQAKQPEKVDPAAPKNRGSRCRTLKKLLKKNRVYPDSLVTPKWPNA